MIIAGFVEGAHTGRGGLGVVGVPPILNSLVARGHKAVLVMAGPPNPNCVSLVVPDPAAILERPDGDGAFGVVTVNALLTWAFAPALLWRFHRLVRSADFVSLHMLHSFPVLVGYFLARLYRKPYGIWPHGVLAPFQRTVSGRKKWLYDKLFAERILNNASVIFYTAAGERDEAKNLQLRSPSVVIPHGIDTNEFASLPPRGAFRSHFVGGHDGPLVLFLARLNAKKGLDLLIDAMRLVVARRPNAKLAIAGPPDPIPFGDRVREWISASGVQSNIVLTGSIDVPTRLEAFSDADIFVLPSQAENFGFAIFEAMASGVPVVVSETVNYAGEIAATRAGISVPRNANEIADAIVELIDQPALRQEMGERGRQLAGRYSWEENGSKLERTILELINHLPLSPELTRQ